MKVTDQELQKFVNVGIAKICPFAYVGQNNCAHFVGHALGIQLGILCNLRSKKENGRASIRVNDIYNNLHLTGLWANKVDAGNDQNLLIFVTSAKNVSGKVMNDSPYKHIGVFSENKVYNYSNHHHKVVAETVDQFFTKCDAVYPGDDITLYYGIFE